MKKKLMVLFSVLLIGLSVSACGQKSVKLAHANRYEPILFFHGWGSSYHAEEKMAQALVKAKVTQTVTRATVSKDGQVTLSGSFRKNDYRPIVEVDFKDSRNSSGQKWGQWAKATVVALQKTYHIQQFDMVGHSMGNMAIVFYLLNNAQNKKLPKLRKQVDIAGHFNGILGMDDTVNKMQLNREGKPNHMQPTYKTLLALRQRYPKNQIDVLNIYGDKNDGTHSDGSVSNASSKSLRYLVADRAKSYREQKITGPNVQHSKLHDNVQVNQLLVDFLHE
ncbi:alpha/beta hydrolase [Lactiplantibacillus fabifermentans T30PCM01]|uniref:Alpha/beta hydrolase n=1 Tax=Lactiplantibacillus fabifermentans T30PCM01 TaxID=1400520 RepID=W6T4F6_9LACO|nr:alpha/beta hydrolase [Lactiplantibacillus fabifermentans]ETY72578.1 alpha/beta hydrolase [Lactiplantibacillus fabifermentans T30PCM01]